MHVGKRSYSSAVLEMRVLDSFYGGVCPTRTDSGLVPIHRQQGMGEFVSLDRPQTNNLDSGCTRQPAPERMHYYALDPTSLTKI